MSYSFQLHNLDVEEMFVLNLRLRVCFEPDNCLLDMDLFTDTELPKPICNNRQNFTISSKSHTMNCFP